VTRRAYLTLIVACVVPAAPIVVAVQAGWLRGSSRLPDILLALGVGLVVFAAAAWLLDLLLLKPADRRPPPCDGRPLAPLPFSRQGGQHPTRPAGVGAPSAPGTGVVVLPPDLSTSGPRSGTATPIDRTGGR